MSTKPSRAWVRITKTAIDRAAIPDTGQTFLRDSELRGFAVRITSGGTKSFVVEKRIHGKVRRKKIGRCSELTLTQAKARAKSFLGRVADGRDPIADAKRQRLSRVTLGQTYLDYLASRPLRPRTRADYDRAIEQVFHKWAVKPLTDITRPMVAELHQRLATDRSEQAANNYMRVLRALFNFAMDYYDDGSGKPVITHNPVLVLTRTRSWYRMERRQTVIRVHQLPAWYRGVESLRRSEHHDSLGETVADLLLFLLFTGLRRTEALTLRWANVDSLEQTFTIPKTKNHKPHTLPYPPFLQRLLERRAVVRCNEFVFPGKTGQGRLVEPKRQIRHVVEHSGIPFSPHDLRRTFLTIGDQLGISSYALKRLVNHSTQNDVTAGYIVSDVERLREPMRQIATYLESALGVPNQPKIVRRADFTRPAVDLMAES